MHSLDLHPLPLGAEPSAKEAQYAAVIAATQAVLSAERDWVAAMATVACLLKGAFAYMHWAGWYCRDTSPGGPANELVVGPYQGGLGCLRIAFTRGVCGAAATTRQSQLVPDVHNFPGHIACASTTQSELVVPLLAPGGGEVVAVLDLDSDAAAAFDRVDQRHLEALCAWLAERYHGATQG